MKTFRAWAVVTKDRESSVKQIYRVEGAPAAIAIFRTEEEATFDAERSDNTKVIQVEVKKHEEQKNIGCKECVRKSKKKKPAVKSKRTKGRKVLRKARRK